MLCNEDTPRCSQCHASHGAPHRLPDERRSRLKKRLSSLPEGHERPRLAPGGVAAGKT